MEQLIKSCHKQYRKAQARYSRCHCIENQLSLVLARVNLRNVLGKAQLFNDLRFLARYL